VPYDGANRISFDTPFSGGFESHVSVSGSFPSVLDATFRSSDFCLQSFECGERSIDIPFCAFFPITPHDGLNDFSLCETSRIVAPLSRIISQRVSREATLINPDARSESEKAIPIAHFR
jgi:hypothetical protein